VNFFLQKWGYHLVKFNPALGQAFPHSKKFDVAGREFDFWIADPLASQWYEKSDLEHCSEARLLIDLVDPGDKVLEIGSHHGFYTTLLAKIVGERGKVVGIEADAKNTMIAQAQLALNRLASHARVFNYAASDSPGRLAMNSRDGTNFYVVEKNLDAEKNVEAVTGDWLDSRFGPFNVLKLDVEGFEQCVLNGCRNLMRRTPKIALELHLDVLADYGAAVDGVLGLLNIDRYQGRMLLPDGQNIAPLDIQAVAGFEKRVTLFLKPLTTDSTTL
jgi:FkbM family methyltransferase